MTPSKSQTTAWYLRFIKELLTVVEQAYPTSISTNSNFSRMYCQHCILKRWAYDIRSRHALSKVMQSIKECIVVSVGGSLIVPDAIDTDFLTRFKALIDRKS